MRETMAIAEYCKKEKALKISFLSEFGFEIRLAPALAGCNEELVLSNEESALFEAFDTKVRSLVIPLPPSARKDRPNDSLPRIRVMQVTNATSSRCFIDLDNLTWRDYPPLTEQSCSGLLQPGPWSDKQAWLAMACFMQYHLGIEKGHAFNKIKDQSISIGGCPTREALQREYQDGVTGVPTREVLKMVEARNMLCRDLILDNNEVQPYVKLLDIKENGFKSLIRLLTTPAQAAPGKKRN